MDAPFPWFGGKRKVASAVWARFGDVPNYCEPFAGSLAVLLARPHAPQIETVNDVDCYVANFWRALQHDSDRVAHYADWPVNEADLSARHQWLVDYRPDRVTREPEYYDARIAGWWVWGQCLWIGREWCISTASVQHQRPHLTSNVGIFRGPIRAYLQSLAVRLRHVRVCCGDWTRVLTPCVTTYHGVCGVLLDPPYAHELRSRCYAEDHDISGDVRRWAIEHGDNQDLRIALCGYEDEHLMPVEWTCIPWTPQRGYSRPGCRGAMNRSKERIWFSPHCLSPGLLWDNTNDTDIQVARR